jgi:hypothetical protein
LNETRRDSIREFPFHKTDLAVYLLDRHFSIDMRRVIPILIVIVIASVSLFGRTAKCPKLTIIGPAGISNPGDRITFLLEIVGGVPSDLSIKWTVERAEIVEGQGTPGQVISKLFGVNVKVVANVDGLPESCEKTASELAGTARKTIGDPFDVFVNLPNNDQRSRLDSYFFDLANYPTHAGFIVIIPGKNGKRAALKRIKFILNHVKFRRFDKGRPVFGIEYNGGASTVLWRVPPRAELHCPDCEIIYGRDL